MKIIHIFKASPITRQEEVESVEIHIEQEISDEPYKTLDEAFKRYEEDAKAISKALSESLPQGTLYRLTVELMGRSAARMGYKGVSE